METAMAIFARAVDAMVRKDYEASLTDFVWLDDNPQIDSPMYQGIRRTFWYFGWATLASRYPAALERMRATLAAKHRAAEAAQAQACDARIDAQTDADIRAMAHALATVDAYDDN